ncbi:hypothetical protein P9281_27495 [Caballeronia sp. LP003]|uniref:hypothetical protein n=1 Tax=Caballeronia sp. LP003 TaxID=3038551 RepID=UPI00286009D7|nr:hypothetical protein [Caballeronia sp. LP003]MDR5790295.1 hypothetical protein [Caballeronia sp. LP003]
MLTIAQAREARQGINLSGDHNQCCQCGLLFNSTAAFDKHRTGAYGVERLCLTRSEMELRGMAKNQQGFRVTERMSVQDDEQKSAALLAQDIELDAAADQSQVMRQP